MNWRWHPWGELVFWVSLLALTLLFFGPVGCTTPEPVRHYQDCIECGVPADA